jgi:hypothetical protein
VLNTEIFECFERAVSTKVREETLGLKQKLSSRLSRLAVGAVDLPAAGSTGNTGQRSGEPGLSEVGWRPAVYFSPATKAERS